MAAGALLVVAAALWLPGAALLRALRPSADPLVLLAGSPVLSVALVWAWAEVVSRLGLAVSWTSVLLPLLVLAVALLLVPPRRWERARPASDTRPAAPTTARWAVLGIVVLAALAAWWVATDGLALVPPGTDGQHHGLMAQRILELGTVQPERLFVLDVLSDGSGWGYYPVALHVVAAVASSATGAPVAVTLNAVVVLGCAVALPAGAYVLTRRLFPAFGWAGPVAALAAVAFPAYPYWLGHWGMYPLLVATALVAPTLDHLLASVQEMRAVPGGLVLGLAGVGLFALHSSELVTVALLGALLVGADVVRRGWTHLRSAAARVGVAALVLLVAVLPRLSSVAPPGALADVDVLPAQSPFDALLYGRGFFFGPLLFLGEQAQDYVGGRSADRIGVTVLGALVLAAVALVGVVVTVRRRVRPEWASGWLAVVLLGLWAAVRLPGVEALTWPWFSQWYRLASSELVFVSTYLGVGACVVAERLVRASRPQLVGAVSVALVALPLVPQLADSRAMLQYDFREMSLADPQARAAWDFLAAHVRPGERVLNDHVDGSGWMYAAAGVAPLFPVKRSIYPGTDDRVLLAEHAGELLTDARARAAADAWDVRWAYVGPRTFPYRERGLDPSALAASPAWRLVFEQDGARVYQRAG